MTGGSLFSGCFGMELGLERSGLCETAWYAEIDKYASAVCKYHKPKLRNHGDATKIDPAELPDTDIITFGWPCQDNSIAGKRKGLAGGTRSSLLTEAVRIIGAKKPKYFIAENVPGLFSVNDGYDFYTAIRMLSDVGYDCQWQVLNTIWFLPQNRERIYIVGHLRGERRPEVFPIGADNLKHGKARQENASKGSWSSCLSTRYGQRWGDETYIRVLQSGRRTMGKVREYINEVPALTENMGTGGGNVPMVVLTNKSGTQTPHKNAVALRSGASLNYQTLVLSRPHGFNKGGLRDAPCLRSSSFEQNELLSDGVLIRRMTPIEGERLQGFPDDWTKYGMFDAGIKVISNTQRYKMTGNAVSVVVAEAIGTIIKGWLDEITVD